MANHKLYSSLAAVRVSCLWLDGSSSGGGRWYIACIQWSLQGTVLAPVLFGCSQWGAQVSMTSPLWSIVKSHHIKTAWHALLSFATTDCSDSLSVWCSFEVLRSGVNGMLFISCVVSGIFLPLQSNSKTVIGFETDVKECCDSCDIWMSCKLMVPGQISIEGGSFRCL